MQRNFYARPRRFLLGIFVTGILLAGLVGCSNNSASSGQSYSFTSDASASFSLASRFMRRANFDQLFQTLGFTTPKREIRTEGPTLCGSVVCATPTALTGKYYGTGFLIQSQGNGMVAYFGQDNWSDITSSSDTYNFDSSSPITNTGNLTCCGGTGDLNGDNTYISDIIYMFGYLDATFTLSGITSNTNMNREFTVRFVLADGAITDGVRGDVLLKDPGDDVFKWMDTSTSAGGDVGAGTLVTSRPASPVTMNTSVVSWTNPFGTDQGNQNIPVLYAGALPESGDGVFTVNEADLDAEGKTYTYHFDPTNFVMFPELLTADKNSLFSYYQLLHYIHLGGLPHSAQSMGVGNPASTILTVTGR